MRGLIVWFVFKAALGVRRSSMKSKGPSIRAADVPDVSGRWTAKASKGMFESNSLSLILPEGSEIRFDVSIEASASIQEDAGLKVLHASSGIATLTAVKQSSGVIAGSFVDPKSSMVYQFSGEEGGDLSFLSTLSANFPDEGEPRMDESEPTPGTQATLSNGTSAQSTAVMDVMVTWTKTAECKNAGMSRGCRLSSRTRAKMKALVELSVVESNMAYSNSKINARLRLVSSYRERTYVEDSMDDALNDLTGTNDGKLDYIHDKRIKKGADLVVLLMDGGGYCGLAWLGPSYRRMFSVVAWNCATGYYSFVHEIGHNLGCNHDLGTTGSCSSSTYNNGWRDPAGEFRSVMGYGCKTDQCDNIKKNGCPRVPYFSNPNVKYLGKPTGSSNANNARRIDDVALTVSNYCTEGRCPGSR